MLSLSLPMTPPWRGSPAKCPPPGNRHALIQHQYREGGGDQKVGVLPAGYELCGLKIVREMKRVDVTNCKEFLAPVAGVGVE